MYDYDYDYDLDMFDDTDGFDWFDDGEADFLREDAWLDDIYEEA